MTDALQRWNALGPEIKRRYTAQGLSQRQFCAKAGVSDTFLRPVERGDAVSLPRPGKLAAVSTALGLRSTTLQRVIDEGITIDEGEGQPTPPQPTAEALDPDVIGLAARAGRLSPEQRAKVEGYIEALLGEEG